MFEQAIELRQQLNDALFVSVRLPPQLTPQLTTSTHYKICEEIGRCRAWYLGVKIKEQSDA